MYTCSLNTLDLLSLLAKHYPFFGIAFFGFLLENMVLEKKLMFIEVWLLYYVGSPIPLREFLHT